MSDVPFTTRDMFKSIEDRISKVDNRQERMEDKLDNFIEINNAQVRLISELDAKVSTQQRMMNAAWGVIGTLVAGLIMLAFFVIQNALRGAVG